MQTALSVPVLANSLCVTAPRANLRAGPGKDHRITWEVNMYMPLVKVGASGEWIKVRDVDNDIHWIFEKMVSDKLDCVTVKTSRANIRKKPSSNAKKWFTVEKYTSFKKEGKEGKWVKIIHEKQEMWIFSTLIWPE